MPGRLPSRILLAVEIAVGLSWFFAFALAFGGSLDMLPSPLLPIGINRLINAVYHKEQTIFDHLVPVLAGIPFGMIGAVACFVALAMFPIFRRIHRLRIKASASLDVLPAMLLLRSFSDTALQEAPNRIHPLAMAATLTILPWPLAQFAFQRAEERELIATIGIVLSGTTRLLMLTPRGSKSSFSLFSEHVEVAVESELWERAFDLLARSSRAVIMLPSATPGVKREAELLRDRCDLLARTVVVLPPIRAGRLTWYNKHPAKNWRVVRESWQAFGI